MTLKNDAKFDEELTCSFKIDMRNLKNFDPSTRKADKFFKFFIMIMFIQNMQKKKIYKKIQRTQPSLQIFAHNEGCTRDKELEMYL